MAYVPRFPVSAFTVGPLTKAAYQTIQSAVDAANSIGGGEVYIQPGSYTENLTLYDEISLVGATGTGDPVIIIGVHVPPASGSVSISNVTLQSATDVFSSAAAGTTTLTLENCIVELTSGYIFNLANWTGLFVVRNVRDFSTANGISNNTGANIVIDFSQLGVATTFVATNSFVNINNSLITTAFNPVGCTLSIDATGFTTVTLGLGTSGIFTQCSFEVTGVPAITMSSDLDIQIYNSRVDSNNNPAIDGAGAGTLELNTVSFIDNTVIAGTLTTTAVSGFLPGSYGTAGQVFTSNGPGVIPSFQNASASGAVMTLTGDSGVATPLAGNINVLGTQGSVFTGASDDLTLSFLDLELPATNAALTEGVLKIDGVSMVNRYAGNNFFAAAGNTTLVGATENIGIGGGALGAITSGDQNIAIGGAAGGLLASGGGNTIVGIGAGSAIETGDENTFVGYNAGSGTGTASAHLVYLGAQVAGSSESNVMRLGATSGAAEITRTVVAGIDGRSTTGASNVVLIDGSDILGNVAGGAVSLNTTTNALNISTDASATTVNIATGAAAKTVTLGSTDTTSSLALRYGTTDFTLASATGTVISALDTGEITMPLQPAFFAYNSANDTNVTGDGTVYTVIFDTEVYDQNSDYNNATGIFTAPVTGRYLFCTTVFVSGITSTAFTTGQLQLVGSNRSPLGQFNNIGALRNAGSQVAYTMAANLDMDAADTAQIQMTVAGSTLTAGIAGGATPVTWFSGQLAC